MTKDCFAVNLLVFKRRTM